MSYTTSLSLALLLGLPVLTAQDPGYGQDPDAGCSVPVMMASPKMPAPKVLPGQKTLLEGRVVAKVPFEIRQGLITIPVRINGSKAVSMVVDTGMSAPITMLHHREALEELGLQGGMRAKVRGAGDEPMKEATAVQGAVLQVGALELKDQHVIVMDQGREGSPWFAEGVIGKSLFDRYVVDIDYERATLTLYEPAEATLGGGFPAIPLELRSGMPVLKGSLDTAGQGLVDVDLLMDLGNSGTVAVNEEPAKGLRIPQKTVEGMGGFGLQGKVMAKLGRLHQLRLGDQVFRDLPATYHEAGRRLMGPAGLAVNVGSQVWRRFRIVLDYPGKRLFLVPNAQVAKPFPFNMAGLSLRHERGGTFRVAHVIPATPAHEQGLQVGDRITALDGKDVRSWNYQQVLERFSEVGQELALEIERGGEKLKKQLRLRQLI